MSLSESLPAAVSTVERKLTRFERLFVAEYAKDLNATHAYVRCGRKPKHAHTCVVKVMARPWIKAAIERMLEAREESAAEDVRRLRGEYRKMAFGQYDGPLLAGHKLQAMEALGKHHGMFKPDSVTVVPVQLSIVGGPPLIPDDSQPYQTIYQSPQEARTLAPATVSIPDKPEPRGR